MRAGTAWLVCVLLVVGCDDAVCGNAVVEGGEECDPGNEGNSMSCYFCAAATGWECDPATGCTGICGDGNLVEDEVCDPTAYGPVNGSNYSYDQSAYCNADCTELIASCGDGVVQSTVEACDDGSEVGGSSGCNRCEVTFGHTCDGSSPSVCTGAPVDEDIVGSDSSAAERSAVCRWYLDLMGGPSTSLTCNGYTTQLRSVSECAAVIGVYLGQCTVGELNWWMSRRGSACGIRSGEQNTPYC